jgi:sirohydrochlorin ferrochelatase
VNETSTRPSRPELFDEGLFDDRLLRAEPGDPVEGPHGEAPHGAGLLLVAHGTRDPAGAAVTEAVTEQVRELSGVQVEPCYVDVRHPTPAEALDRLPGPVIAVPMFLAAGYHVRVDVPAQLAATGRDDVRLAETFGPDPALVAAAAARLRGAGMRDGDAVVLAVAGSSDPFAQADGATAAMRLARALRAPVTLATIAAGGPRVGEAVARLRAEGASRVAVASWLLAPGLFQRSLAESGADVVAEPLATHGAVAGLVIARYTAAVSSRSSVA